MKQYTRHSITNHGIITRLQLIGTLVMLILSAGCQNKLPKPEGGLEMVYINLERATIDEANAILAIQGMVNRDGPKIFVFQGQNNKWGRFVGKESNNGGVLSAEFRSKYRNTDDLFEEYYIQKRGFTKREIVSFSAFFEEFKPYIKGTIRYDQSQVAQRVVAFSYSSAVDYVPVTDQLLRAYPLLAGIEIKESLPGKFIDPLELQKWAYEKIGAKCTRSAVASYFVNETWLSIDHGIAQRTFFFNLNYRPSENKAEYDFMQKILANLKPGSAVLGWGNGEDAILAAIASYEIYLQCDPAPNLSFHRAVKPLSVVMPNKKTSFNPSAVKLENKYYVAFMINEGDTLKCMGTFYNGGQWFWPQRGKLPINWGTNPAIIEQYPALMEAIHSTMSEHDLFFSSITGYGYYNPKYSSGTDYFTKQERATNPLGHITTGSIYSVHNMIDATNGIMDAKTDRWLVNRGCDGYVFESAQGTNLQFTSALQPVIGVDWRLFYSRYRYEKGVDPVRGAIDTIKSLAEHHAAPFLIPMYAGSPAEFKQIADALPADKFKVVLMDEMIELAKRIGETHLDRETLAIQGETERKVTLTVRNLSTQPRNGVITVKAPSQWRITPNKFTYSGVAQMSTRQQEFVINVPTTFTGSDQVVFSDSANGRSIPLTVTRTATVAVPVKPPLARTVFASYATPVIDGSVDDWAGLSSSLIIHNLAALNQGAMQANYRLAWDSENLYILVEEKAPPKTVIEAFSQKEFGGGDFKLVNGASFWMDFTGKGTTQNGDFSPRFAFSSTKQTDSYICTINNQVLVSSRPQATIATSGLPGHRVIEASIKWREIDALLNEENLPYGGIQQAVRPGYGFGLQPLLIESKKNQAFLNGFSPGIGGNTSVLDKKVGNSGPPSGADADSIWIELK